MCTNLLVVHHLNPFLMSEGYLLFFLGCLLLVAFDTGLWLVLFLLGVCRHHVFELRPQGLDGGEFISNLRVSVSALVTIAYHRLQHDSAFLGCATLRRTGAQIEGWAGRLCGI